MLQYINDVRCDRDGYIYSVVSFYSAIYSVFLQCHVTLFGEHSSRVDRLQIYVFPAVMGPESEQKQFQSVHHIFMIVLIPLLYRFCCPVFN